MTEICVFIHCAWHQATEISFYLPQTEARSRGSFKKKRYGLEWHSVAWQLCSESLGQIWVKQRQMLGVVHLLGLWRKGSPVTSLDMSLERTSCLHSQAASVFHYFLFSLSCFPWRTDGKNESSISREEHSIVWYSTSCGFTECCQLVMRPAICDAACAGDALTHQSHERSSGGLNRSLWNNALSGHLYKAP